MKKIQSLFQRNYDGDRLVRNEVVPGSEWVLDGEGIATQKFDGTCCMVKDGVLYKRYDAKKGKTQPDGFIPAQEPDEKTGHWPGWVLVSDTDPADQYFREAFNNGTLYEDGTYELVGPKINGNPEFYAVHVLLKHGSVIILGIYELSFDGIRDTLSRMNIEGIVWHHPDGRMVKIKKKDFGLKREVG